MEAWGGLAACGWDFSAPEGTPEYLKGENDMFSKEITYTDYDGNQRTETFYFNISRAEVIKMDLMIPGGLEKMLQKAASLQDGKRFGEFLEMLILKAYGEKSEDGRRFVKSDALSEAFAQTEAYSELWSALLTDKEFATEFLTGIMPAAEPAAEPGK